MNKTVKGIVTISRTFFDGTKFEATYNVRSERQKKNWVSERCWKMDTAWNKAVKAGLVKDSERRWYKITLEYTE